MGDHHVPEQRSGGDGELPGRVRHPVGQALHGRLRPPGRDAVAAHGQWVVGPHGVQPLRVHLDQHHHVAARAEQDLQLLHRHPELQLGLQRAHQGPGGGAICSTFAVTKNVYDGPDWWGTITFKNGGPYHSYNYKVEFDIPSGYHCTNDYVPPGATLSPLTGSGSSAHTVSNHCVFSWSNASPIAPGGNKTINYSTDNNKTSFKSASNLQVSDQQTCVGTPSCTATGNFCSNSAGPACCGGNGCVDGTCQPNMCVPQGTACTQLVTNCCTSCSCGDPLHPENCFCL